MINYFRRHPVRRDFLFFLILISFILMPVLVLTLKGYVYGCNVDWVSQHSTIPEYFRQTFYDTGDLFPDFNMNLGAGQNAYNFSYYGYMNPIILISYFFPFVSMENYIIISSIAVVILSVVLFFFWMKSKCFVTPMILYISTIMFACASPLTFHSHMQVMFMDYMPFMIMSLMGVDRLVKNSNGILLSISIALMFLTSYYFAFSGMFAIGIYWIYAYVSNREILMFGTGSIIYGHTKRAKLQDYFSGILGSFGRLMYSSISGILISCAIILPSFATILSGRESGAISYNNTNMFMPSYPASSLLYSPYGIGTVSISVIAIVTITILDKNISSKILGVIMILITSFPFAWYILNGFLYVRTKSLIPFLPIAIFMTAIFLAKLSAGRYSVKAVIAIGTSLMIFAATSFITEMYFQYAVIALFDLTLTTLFLYVSIKYNRPKIICCIAALLSLFVCLTANYNGSYLSKKNFGTYYNTEKMQLIKKSLSDEEGIFRSSDLCNVNFTLNKIYNKSYFSNSCYSSIVNKNYLKLCNNDLNLNNPTVNGISIVSSSDILFNSLMGVKNIYAFSKGIAPAGCTKTMESENYSVYRNDNAYSLGFATDKTMNVETYKKLSDMDKELALLEYIVTDTGNCFPYESRYEKVNIDTSMGLKKDDSGYYHVDTLNGRLKYTIDVPDNLKDYVYIVKCRIKEYGKNRATIRVNGIQNCLSEMSCAFPNDNFEFKYVISSNTDLYQLNIEFPPNCKFDFSGFEIYRISYETIKKLKDSHTMLEDIEFVGNNMITGSIDVDNPCQFTTTIPYDDGFTVYLDDQKIEHRKTDNAFIGFQLPAGKHDVKIVYHAPLARAGKIMSLIGLFALLPMIRKKSTSR